MRTFILVAMLLAATPAFADPGTAKISSMTPTSGPTGTKLEIYGTGLEHVMWAKFESAPLQRGAVFAPPHKGDVKIFIEAPAYCFSTTDGRQVVKTHVPANAKTGDVVLELTAHGHYEMVSAGTFEVVAAVSPPSAPPAGGGSPRNPGSSGPLPPTPKAPESAPSGAPISFDPDVDLPIAPPVFGKQVARAPDPPKPVEEPPKTPVPTFWGKDLKSESSSVIFVVDISGSMAWPLGKYASADGAPPSTSPGEPSRWERSKAELTKTINGLPASWHFAILAFDCTGYWWGNPSLEPDLRLATPENKQGALAFIGDLQPNGSTGTGPNVSQALQLAKSNKLIVLLTDGAPNCGAGDELGDASCIAAHLSMIDAGNAQNAEIDVFGIGATLDFRGFCEDVAQHNRGSYIDVR